MDWAASEGVEGRWGWITYTGHPGACCIAEKVVTFVVASAFFGFPRRS